MSLIERYLFRTATSAFLAGLFALTGVIWITQALRQVDLLTSKGQTIIIFLLMTGLTIPSLLAIIAPVALFAGVLYSLNKFNGDSELIVMSASGVSPWRLIRPYLFLFVLVYAFVAALYFQVMPWSFDLINSLTTRIHADFITNFARPGAFSELEQGFVFHFREHAPDGSLRGVFMQDRRDLAKATTYIAEIGKTVDKDGANYLVLRNGSYQRPQERGDSAMVTFDDYTIDLSQFAHKAESAKRPRERSTTQLFSENLDAVENKRIAGRLRAELLDRLASPLYAFAAGLIGFAALGEARTTRQGRGMATLGAILVFAAVRLSGIAVNSIVVAKPAFVVAVWGIPIGISLLAFERSMWGKLGGRLPALKWSALVPKRLRALPARLRARMTS